MVLSKKLWAVVLGVMLAVAGCGDSDDGVGNGGGGGGENGGGGGDTNYTYTGRTVTIGNLTWMAENLNRNTSNSWCYGDDASNCAKYGRLYTWDAAMSACPNGWRLPAQEDWDGLAQASGDTSTAGTALKSNAPNWDGTNDLGFSALPGGSRGSAGTFLGIGSSGYWWTATDGGPGSIGSAWGRHMYSGRRNVPEHWGDKAEGFSVRCVN